MTSIGLDSISASTDNRSSLVLPTLAPSQTASRKRTRPGNKDNIREVITMDDDDDEEADEASRPAAKRPKVTKGGALTPLWPSRQQVQAASCGSIQYAHLEPVESDVDVAVPAQRELNESEVLRMHPNAVKDPGDWRTLPTHVPVASQRTTIHGVVYQLPELSDSQGKTLALRSIDFLEDFIPHLLARNPERLSCISESQVVELYVRYMDLYYSHTEQPAITQQLNLAKQAQSGQRSGITVRIENAQRNARLNHVPPKAMLSELRIPEVPNGMTWKVARSKQFFVSYFIPELCRANLDHASQYMYSSPIVRAAFERFLRTAGFKSYLIAPKSLSEIDAFLSNRVAVEKCFMGWKSQGDATSSVQVHPTPAVPTKGLIYKDKKVGELSLPGRFSAATIEPGSKSHFLTQFLPAFLELNRESLASLKDQPSAMYRSWVSHLKWEVQTAKNVEAKSNIARSIATIKNPNFDTGELIARASAMLADAITAKSQVAHFHVNPLAGNGKDSGGITRPSRVAAGPLPNDIVVSQVTTPSDCSQRAGAIQLSRRVQGHQENEATVGPCNESLLQVQRDSLGRSIAECRRLFVGNVSFTARVDDLSSLFAGFTVLSVDLPRSKADKSTGYAYVELGSANEAERAIAQLDGQKHLGRKLFLQLSKQRFGAEKRANAADNGTLVRLASAKNRGEASLGESQSHSRESTILPLSDQGGKLQTRSIEVPADMVDRMRRNLCALSELSSGPADHCSIVFKLTEQTAATCMLEMKGDAQTIHSAVKVADDVMSLAIPNHETPEKPVPGKAGMQHFASLQTDKPGANGENSINTGFEARKSPAQSMELSSLDDKSDFQHACMPAVHDLHGDLKMGITSTAGDSLVAPSGVEVVEVDTRNVGQVALPQEDSTSQNNNVHTKSTSLSVTNNSILLQIYYPGVDSTSCLNCLRRDHQATHCPSLTCAFCGLSGVHFSAACPQNQKCSKCLTVGHVKANCSEKLRAPRNAKTICGSCHSEDHDETDCHLLWRSFKPETAVLHKVRTIPVFCYSCGSPSHYGTECGVRPLTRLRTGGKTWSKSNLTRYLDYNSKKLAVNDLEVDPIRRDVPVVKEFNIKGKGKAPQDPIELQDSDDDVGSFLAPKSNQAKQPGQIQINKLRSFQPPLPPGPPPSATFNGGGLPPRNKRQAGPLLKIFSVEHNGSLRDSHRSNAMRFDGSGSYSPPPAIAIQAGYTDAYSQNANQFSAIDDKRNMPAPDDSAYYRGIEHFHGGVGYVGPQRGGAKKSAQPKKQSKGGKAGGVGPSANVRKRDGKKPRNPNRGRGKH